MQYMCLIYVFDLTKIEIRFVIWQSHCSAIVSPHLSVEELIEFFVNISRRSEKGMAVMLAQSTSNCRVYQFTLLYRLIVWYFAMPSNYRTCAIISRGLYIYYPISKDHFFVLRRFFQKILSLCIACIQERLRIKSGLWWRVRYTDTALIKIFINVCTFSSFIFIL